MKQVTNNNKDVERMEMRVRPGITAGMEPVLKFRWKEEKTRGSSGD